MKKYLIIILLICIFILTGCSNTKFNITNTVEDNYMKQNSEAELQALVEESDTYFAKVVALRVQDIRPVESLAS